MRKAYSNGLTIIASPLPVVSTQSGVRVDLLIYNSVNEGGFVLSSVIYVSEPKDKVDEAPIVYDSKNLFTNVTLYNEIEKDFTFTNYDQYKVSQSFNSKINSANYTYNTATDFVPHGNGEILLDGWYTMSSVFLPERTIGFLNSIKKNYWCNVDGEIYRATKDYPQTANDLESIYTIGDQSEPIYNKVNIKAEVPNKPVNAIKSYDFFVHDNVLALYHKILNKSMADEFCTGWMSIKPKLRTIESAIEQENYPLAQYVLQSMDYAIISQLI